MILQFENEYSFLSNFFMIPVIWRGRIYVSNEHFYQAHKAITFGDHEAIRLTATPKEAKKMGRKIKCIASWEDDKLPVMLLGLELKFRQHAQLRQYLLETGDQLLVEGNTWHDNIWGDCHCPNCVELLGQNLLGRSLMHVRAGMRHDAID